jgi:hypothetical protein
LVRRWPDFSFLFLFPLKHFVEITSLGRFQADRSPRSLPFEPIDFQNAFHAPKQDFDLFSLAPRDSIVGSLSYRACNFACCFMSMMRHFADISVGTALQLQRASDRSAFSHTGTILADRPAAANPVIIVVLVMPLPARIRLDHARVDCEAFAADQFCWRVSGIFVS